MTPNTYRTEDYLRHMLEAIRRIAAYLQGFDRSSFDRDSRTQDAVIRNLEVIGEPACNVLRRDPAFVAAHPEIPWSLAYRTRNALSHGYADVDIGTVWNTARTDLPQLEDRLLALLKKV